MIHCGDAITILRGMESESIHCCVTSPPYFGLRDYGIAGQLGLESTPDEYVSKLVAVFAEVRRVLRKDGTLWLNLGDSYWGGKGENGSSKARSTADERGYIQSAGTVQMSKRPQDGRQKTACMPESVRDRCTRSHEYVFMFAKSKKYFYDAAAIAEPAIYGEPNAPDKIASLYGQRYTRRAKYPNSIEARKDRASMDHKSAPTPIKNGIRPHSDKQCGHSRRHAGFNDRWDSMEKGEQCSGMRNKRSVWRIGPQPFPEAHFATFPEKLVEPCIFAGCPHGGTVLDPFCGSGTTGIVTLKSERQFVGIELNPEYIKMAERRIYNECPMAVNG